MLVGRGGADPNGSDPDPMPLAMSIALFAPKAAIWNIGCEVEPTRIRAELRPLSMRN